MKHLTVVKVILVLNLLLLSCNSDNVPNVSVNEWIETSNLVEYDENTPESQGISISVLDNLANSLEAFGFVHSFLISKDNQLIHENYFNGSNSTSAFNAKSVSKCFISTLTGIAINDGVIEGIQDRVLSYFPEYESVNEDMRIHDLNLEHLLTMSSGFNYVENQTPNVLYSDNWIKNTLALDFVFTPGTSYKYGTPQSHIMSGVITEATNSSTLTYANNKLFTPLGISIAEWPQDPQGYYFGGSEVYMTTRGLLKFGDLFLDNGIYNGNQLISQEWVELAIEGKFSGFTGSINGFSINNYGFYWYVSDDGGLRSYFAWGYGGQFILMIPEKEICIAITSEITIDGENSFLRSGAILKLLRDELFIEL